MNDALVLNSLLTLFNMEIQNQFIMCNEGVIIDLSDGTKAIIKIKEIS